MYWSDHSKWEFAGGFDGLSDGAKAIARYADSHNGSITGAIKENPELINSLDEFHQWSAIAVPEISGNGSINATSHSLRDNFQKK